MKIMIVDDSVRMRKMIRDVFNNSGNEFFECDDGNGAVTGFEIFQPDIVIMDIKMNLIDGITATSKIIKNFPDAKIYIVTNYDEPDLKSAAKNAGASGYFIKDDLLKMVHIIKRNIAK